MKASGSPGRWGGNYPETTWRTKAMPRDLDVADVGG